MYKTLGDTLQTCTAASSTWDKTQLDILLTRNTLFLAHVTILDLSQMVSFFSHSHSPLNHKPLGVTFIQMSNRDGTVDKSVLSGFHQLVKEFSAAESDFLNFSNTTRVITQMIKRLTRMVITKVMTRSMASMAIQVMTTPFCTQGPSVPSIRLGQRQVPIFELPVSELWNLGNVGNNYLLKF